MDLSVATAKPTGREDVAGAVAATESPGAGAVSSDENNPATFRPRAGAGPQIDRSLVIKGVLAVGVLAAAVLVLVVAIRFITSDTPARAPVGSATPATIAVEPVAGEPTITLFASAPASVTVTQVADGKVLLRIRLAAGEQRTIPHRGQLQIEANPPEAVQLEIAKRRHPMPPGKDGLPVKSAVIKGP
jgi:hypothetical protein